MPPTDGITDQVEIGRIELSARACIVVRTLRLRGEPRADIRKFVINRDGQEVPTRMGVSLPYERVDQLRELVARLAAECSAGAPDDGVLGRS